MSKTAQPIYKDRVDSLERMGRRKGAGFLLLLAVSMASMVLIRTVTVSAQEPEKEVVVISVHPEGFEPREIKRPAGPFLLVINDRTGLDETVIQIDRVAGSRLALVRISNRSMHWNQPADLPVGDYLVTEANHPGWSCEITITPR